MNINSKLNLIQAQNCNQKTAVPAFGKKYPFTDVMTIMSGTYAHNEASVSKTVEELLGRKGSNPMEQFLDFLNAGNKLNKKYPELKRYADSFYNAVNKNSQNPFSITKEDAARVIAKETEKYGSKFIDVEI